MKILKQKDIKKYRDDNLEESFQFSTSVINPVLDHDHKTGYIRGTIDRELNQYIGKLEQNYIRFIKWKFPDVEISDLLHEIANYLGGDYSDNPLHPNAVKKEVNKFNTLTKVVQETILKSGDVIPAKTKAERKKQYRAYLMRPENIYEVK